MFPCCGIDLNSDLRCGLLFRCVSWIDQFVCNASMMLDGLVLGAG